jgi:DNA-binding LacI/PurR family transcriptional regulator
MASTRVIAQQAGVSIGTVSRVLNNKPGVSDSTRQRVLAVIERLSYVPPKRVVIPHVTHVGLLIRPFAKGLPANPFYADVYHGVEEICREYRFNLSLSTLDISDARLSSLPALASDERIAGVIVVGAISTHIIETLTTAIHAPVVLVDNWYPGCPWDAVMIDNMAGAAAATELLIRHGHRNIALVGGPDHPSIVERREAYRRAMLDAGLEPLVVRADDLEDDAGVAAADQLLRLHPQTTAVIGSNDMQTIGVMKRLQALGYRIPDDMSLVGFDDIMLAQHTSPPITTVHVDRSALGRSGVEVLLARLSAPERAPVRAIVGVTLIERATVACPRTRGITG